jgi:hypothetical protein
MKNKRGVSSNQPNANNEIKNVQSKRKPAMRKRQNYGKMGKPITDLYCNYKNAPGAGHAPQP